MQFSLAAFGILLALGAASPARAGVLGASLDVSTATLTGGAFSVGGTAFSVSGGQVGIGTSSPSGTMQVVGLINADNRNAAPTFSTQPGTRFAAAAANTWYYTGESVTFTVPAGPSRRYRLVLRQMVINNNAGSVIFGVGPSASSPTGFIFEPYQFVAAAIWSTLNADMILTLAPGTYSYYVWVDYTAAVSGPSLACASTDSRNYCDLFVYPL